MGVLIADLAAQAPALGLEDSVEWSEVDHVLYRLHDRPSNLNSILR